MLDVQGDIDPRWLMTVNREAIVVCDVCGMNTHPREDGTPRCPLHLGELPQGHSGKARAASKPKPAKDEAS